MTGEIRTTEPSRRDVLALGWHAIGAIVLAASGFIGLRFLSSRSVRTDFGTVITAGQVDDFAPGTVTPFDNAPISIVRGEDGGFLALYRRCTHLDCTILWDALDDHFRCPCHGSVFSRCGDVLNPPAPRPLERFAITIDEGGQIQVDTGDPIERTRVAASDFTYPQDLSTLEGTP